MTYSTLMVHLELGRSNAVLLQGAVDFARRFDSEVIGITGCQPMPLSYAEGYGGDMVAQEQKGIDEEIKAAEAEFRNALSSVPAGEAALVHRLATAQKRSGVDVEHK